MKNAINWLKEHKKEVIGTTKLVIVCGSVAAVYAGFWYCLGALDGFSRFRELFNEDGLRIKVWKLDDKTGLYIERLGHYALDPEDMKSFANDILEAVNKPAN